MICMKRVRLASRHNGRVECCLGSRSLAIDSRAGEQDMLQRVFI